LTHARTYDIAYANVLLNWKVQRLFSREIHQIIAFFPTKVLIFMLCAYVTIQYLKLFY